MFKINVLSENADVFSNVVVTIYQPDSENKVASLVYANIINPNLSTVINNRLVYASNPMGGFYKTDNISLANDLITYDDNQGKGSIFFDNQLLMTRTMSINASTPVRARYVRLSRKDGWDLRYTHISFYTTNDQLIDTSTVTYASYPLYVSSPDKMSPTDIINTGYVPFNGPSTTRQLYSVSNINTYNPNNTYVIVYDLKSEIDIAYIKILAPYPPVGSYYFKNVTISLFTQNTTNVNQGDLVSYVFRPYNYPGVHIIDFPTMMGTDYTTHGLQTTMNMRSISGNGTDLL